MTGQADGHIRILVDTEIDSDGFIKDSKTLQSEAKRLGTKVESLGATFQKTLGGNPKSLETFQAKAAELQQTVDRLAADLAKLGAKKAPTDAYKDLSAETEKAGRELEKLLNRQDKLDNRGASKTSQSYKNLQADIAAASARYDELVAKKKRMEASGTAWTSGTETAEYQGMAAAIDAANARLGAMRERVAQVGTKMQSLTYTQTLWNDLGNAASYAIGTIRSGIESAMTKSQAFAAVVRTIQYAWNSMAGPLKAVLSVVKSIGSAVGKVAKGVANLAKTVAKKLLSAFKSVLAAVKKLFTGNKSLSGSVGGLTSTLKKLVPAMLAARGVMGILRKGVNAFLEANEQVSSQLQACWNSLGNVLGPIITRIVNLVSTAISYVTAFLRLLGFGISNGASTISTMGKAVASVGSSTKTATISTVNLGKTATAAYGAAGNAARVAAIKTDEFGNKSAVALNSVGGAATIAADEINAVGDAAESTAKKIQNLSGLDQLNIWKSEQDTSSGGGGGAGGGIGDLGVALPEVELPDWAKLLAEQLRNGEWKVAAKTLSDKLNEMVDSVGWPGLGDRLGEKLAGVLKFLATFIREFDFVDLFTGLFTALEHAIDKLNAEDLGTLLASKFIIITSALQGVVESGVIPALAEKAVKIIGGFFTTIRTKFTAEEAPNGWTNVGATFGNVINSIVEAIGNLLSGETWSGIAGDIRAFFGGLKSSLTTAEAKQKWSNMFANLRRTIAGLALWLRKQIPGLGALSPFWRKLEQRIEAGDNIEWIDVFSALTTLLGELAVKLVEYLTSNDWAAFWDKLKNNLAQALGSSGWEALKDDVKEKIFDAISNAWDEVCDLLYEYVSGKSEALAYILFPDRSAVNAAVQNLKGYLITGSLEAAQSQLDAMIENGCITAAEAERIAHECGYSYVNGILAALPDVESASEQFSKTAGDGLDALNDTVDEKLDGTNRVIDNRLRPTRPTIRKPFEDARGDVADEIAGMSADVEGGYDTMAATVGDKSSGMDSDNSTHWRAMKSLLVSMADVMKGKVVSVYAAMGEKIKTIMSQSDATSKTGWESIKTSAVSNLTAMRTRAGSDMQAIQQSIAQAMAKATASVTEQWALILQAAESGTEGMKSAVVSGFNSLPGAVSSALGTLRSTVSSAFNTLKNSAYSWGADLGALLASGLRSKISTIAAAASSAAATARSYLHFSVPDKGPLADADEYGPDFIKLLADGMTKNQSLAARAASRVATAISDGIRNGEYTLPEIQLPRVDTAMDNFGDKITAGFSSMIDRLQAIADSVTFRIPTVATAGAVPYSVTGSNTPARNDGDLLDILKQISAKVDTLSRSQQNRQYVFKANMNGHEIFREVIREGKLVRSQSGNNPFHLGNL